LDLSRGVAPFGHDNAKIGAGRVGGQDGGAAAAGGGRRYGQHTTRDFDAYERLRT
jgi:hypothetical protein